MADQDEEKRRGIQSIEVGGRLLVALADAGTPLLLKALAAKAHMAPAKAHPYLVSFGKLGLVTQDPATGRYGLGALALRMGLASLRQLNPVRLAIAAAAELEQQLHHTVALSVWGNAGPTVIHLEESSQPIHMNLRTGTVMTLTTATGMVFGAYMPAKMMERFVTDTLSSDVFAHLIGERKAWAALQDALREVRRHGLARVKGKPIPGVNALAAPVFDHQGHLALVITVIGPTGGLDIDWGGANAAILRDAAQRISAQLGFSATAG